MSKNKYQYICTECKRTHLRDMGRCNGCGEYGTIEKNTTVTEVSQRAVGVKTSGAAKVPRVRAARPKEINTTNHKHTSTGIGELDRVLGGGFIPGGVILLAGEPGAGKSTLTTHVAEHAGMKGMKVLLCSSEESREQIKLRADRLGSDSDNFYIASTTDVAEVLGHIEAEEPDLLIVDSLQTMGSSELEGRAGSVTQVVEVATLLTRIAKARNIPLILIGQVTKDGNIAGPRTVEHLVDVVIHFEGDRDSSLRLLRGVKNRYGPADEIGCFEHTERGILEVPDPSGLLLGRRDKASAGVATGIILEGRRCLPIEIQALTVQTHLPMPRRAVSGLDSARSIMSQAVVQRHARVNLQEMDIFLSTIGGITAKEPSIDLAVGLALMTARYNVALPIDMVVIGELTLSGDVRMVTGLERRLNEAKRLGFTQAIVPQDSGKLHVPGMTLYQVSDVREAKKLVETHGTELD